MSLTHFLLLGFILALVFGRNRLTDVFRSLGESKREFKKGLNGESDIDITDSVKRYDDKD